MCVLFALAIGVDSVVRVAPHDDVQDLVNDAVGHIKVPAAILSHLAGSFKVEFKRSSRSAASLAR